ncbi:MAG: vanadium-dependent haloperoxidase [Sediminibacterium sp.]|nr:vanadium-dependent haloperoxidase [Sediminibacterium sp.]
MLLFFFIIFFFSCKPTEDNSKQIFNNPLLFSNTVYQLNEVVMGNNFSPIVASRNYVYAAIAGYEIIATGYPQQFNSLKGQLHGLEKVPTISNKEKINVEYACILAYCRVGEAVTFPAGSMKDYIDSIKNLALKSGMNNEVKLASEEVANQFADAIIAWSKKDNYAQTRSAEKYNIQPNIEGRWTPTPPAYSSAMEPHWAEIRPMILDSSNQFRPAKPIPFNIKDKNSDYYKQVMAIKIAVDTANEEQKWIANFWDDNPFKLNVIGHVMFGTKKFSPPGHWMGIVGIVAKKANYDFANTVYAFASAAITMFDAFIHTWDAKYTYNTARPETIINKYIDQNWRPLLQTPPFPEYTCGHSTISAAVAESLTNIFGDKFNYIDSTETPFGIKPRSFSSFRQAALENNIARFYGGIHYHSSCIISTNQGIKVGQFIVSKLNMKNKIN